MNFKSSISKSKIIKQCKSKIVNNQLRIQKIVIINLIFHLIKRILIHFYNLLTSIKLVKKFRLMAIKMNLQFFKWSRVMISNFQQKNRIYKKMSKMVNCVVKNKKWWKNYNLRI